MATNPETPRPPGLKGLQQRWAELSRGERVNAALYALTALSMAALLLEVVVGDEPTDVDLASRGPTTTLTLPVPASTTSTTTTTTTSTTTTIDPTSTTTAARRATTTTRRAVRRDDPAPPPAPAPTQPRLQPMQPPQTQPRPTQPPTTNPPTTAPPTTATPTTTTTATTGP